MENVAKFRGWTLHALAVRVTHVHLVVSAPVSSAKILHDFKAWPTRRLRENGLVNKDQQVWATHGSMRYLNDDASIHDAVHYVMESQGSTLNEPRQ